jgi:hypothetical protein
VTPDEIIASVVALRGPVTEWNLCDPAELVAAWRLALSRPVPVEVTAEDMEWARRVFAEDAVKREVLADRDALRARVAELERDAARYRWLREDATTGQVDAILLDSSALWDSLIDAAMQESSR